MSKKDTNKWKKAVWQYMIDHARVKSDGSYLITIPIPDQEAFWYRIQRRERGEFSRVDIKRMEVEAEAARNRTETALREAKMTKRWHVSRTRRINALRATGSKYWLLLLWLRSKINYRLTKKLRETNTFKTTHTH